MKRFNRTALATAVGLAILGLGQVTEAKDFKWTTVVNNGFFVPACAQTDGTRLFNSYSQPSINEAGLVVFRGRSKGSDGGGGEGGEAATLEVTAAEVGAPARGVYSRNMGRKDAPINVVACVRSAVPDPNNLYGQADNTSGEVLGTFNEFPAFPRMDATSSSIATRGQSTPVWEYVVDALDNTTKAGTSGVYVDLDGDLITGASLLGAVPKVYSSTDLEFPEYSVPGTDAVTKFDQFPGSPTIAGGFLVAFKGNFTVKSRLESVGKTGVFFRDVSDETNLTYLVANSLSTNIPGTTQVFGSTAPPTAAGSYVFFVGSDNEDNPTEGGIYRSPMDTTREPSSPPVPRTLIGIGTAVPAETANFNRFGEGLSVSKDANLVAFWGAWGDAKQTITLKCPADGNKAIKEACLLQSELKEGEDLDPKLPENHTGVTTRYVPANQGIFVHNISTGVTVAIAKTGQYGYSDFLYWVFSGAPPGKGEGDSTREPPRWRSSAFAAVSLIDSATYAVAFKGTQDGVPGIFLGDGSAAAPLTVVKVGDLGKKIDPLAPALSKVTAIGIERDGFRGQNLAITSSMLYEGVDPVTGLPVSVGWAGIYLTNTGKSLK